MGFQANSLSLLSGVSSTCHLNLGEGSWGQLWRGRRGSGLDLPPCHILQALLWGDPARDQWKIYLSLASQLQM